MASKRSDFDSFVQRQQEISVAAKNEPPFDPKKELADWIAHLNALYSNVRIYLADYLSDGSISLTTENKALTEEFSGPYIAPKMVIHIGLQDIKLDPIGTMLIGSKGRVDVIGKAGTSRLTLIDKNLTSFRQMVTVTVIDPAKPPPPKTTVSRQEIEWVWKIISRPPADGFIELNKESFLQMLLEVSNG